MAHRGRTRTTVVAAAVTGAILLATAAPSDSQVLDDATSTTSTTAAPSSTSTTALFGSPPTTAPDTSSPPATAEDSTTTTTTATAAPGSTEPGASPSAEGGDEEAGEGEGDATAPATPRTVPADARRIIDSVVRSRPNSSAALNEAVGALVDLGMTRDEAIRIGFGRFPVAGVANYSHDWLFPRYGPGFRFHKGTDVFAPYGTPLRAVVDGIATAKSSALGGLSVKVTTPDSTYFYYAHLSALPDGFVSGMAVQTGDIVGFVGDSGNAKGGSPHLHIGVYPRGGEATDPKPILDQFLADALERLPAIIEQVEASVADRPASAAPVAPATPRSLLATSLLRPLTDRTASTDVPTEILYQASANPSAGGASVAQTEAEHLAASIDWESWRSRSDLGRDLLRRTEAVLRVALGERSRSSDDAETAGP